MKFFYLLVVTCLFITCPSLSASISASEKNKLVTEIRQSIQQHYVEETKIKGISSRLAKLTNDQEFTNSQSENQLASLLDTELKKVDKHFAVKWQAPGEQGKSESKEPWFTQLKRKNSGFNRVDILDGNVGYIEFWGFDLVTDKSKQIVERVMGFVADTDALILDLRNNGGGSPDMVSLISSYLLKPNTHLNSIYWRSTNSQTDYFTQAINSTAVNIERPVYILTSADTFSAAEEFSYNLKHLKRATIIGETTKGGANPWRFFELTQGFKVAVPIAKAINPNTGSNWESVGVIPDVKTSREEAKQVAYGLALATLKTSVTNPYQLQEIKDNLVLQGE